jgi:hypothetical protein
MRYEDLSPEMQAAFKQSSLPFDNQSTVTKAANVQAKATANAADRMLQSTDLVGPAVTVHNFDGVPTVVARPPLGAIRGIAQLVSEDELSAMGIDPERFPNCEVPGCKGQGRYKIISGSGKPLSINRHGQIVAGELQPLVEESMSRHDRARAELASIGIGQQFSRAGGAGVAPAQLSGKSFVNVCLEHQTLPVAPSAAPAKRYVSGPYAGYALATARRHSVMMRTRQEPEVFAVMENGRDAFYVRGDDGASGYSGKLVEL